MIFDKILKTKDADFEICLDKQVYNAGENVKGMFKIIIYKDINTRKIKFIAEGVEKTSIEAGSSSSSNTSNTYTETDFFFLKDLTDVLSNVNSNMNNIGNKDEFISVIRKGVLEVPFNFTIPVDALPSYYGKGAKITYHIKATLDRANWIDKNKIKDFQVKNSNHQVRTVESNIIEEKDTIDDSANYKSSITDQKLDSSMAGKSTNKKAQKVIDSFDFRKYNFNYHWYRKKYSNQDNRVLIELANDENSNNDENKAKMDRHRWNKYFQGKVINGNVTIQRELLTSKPSNLEVTLTGIEYASANIYNTISETETYKLELIPTGSDLSNSPGKTFTGVYPSNDNHKGYVPLDSIVIPFCLKIPEVKNKSYLAKYSEYIWVLDFKINIPFSKDIHSKEIIAIV
ncbi:MAG: hypothetical protein ACTHKK_11240 [Candidatus Nitrosocosmicus sp.]